MKLKDFTKGLCFWTATGKWICTDVGSRVIVAIKYPEDPRDLEGPPYSVAERVFDEYDLDGMYPTQKSLTDNIGGGIASSDPVDTGDPRCSSTEGTSP